MKTQTVSTIKKTGLGAKASRTLGNTVVYIILSLITVIWLFPFWSTHLSSRQVAKERANEKDQSVQTEVSQLASLNVSTKPYPAQDCMSWSHTTWEIMISEETMRELIVPQQ